MGRISGRIDGRGAFVELKVMASPQRVAALKRAGRAFAQPMTHLALIDTGASNSVIDVRIAADLGLVPTGRVPIHTPSSGTTLDEMDAFDITLVMESPGSRPESFTVGAVGGNLAPGGFYAILGRDVLDSCVLTYDGPVGSYTIEFGQDALNRPNVIGSV